MRRLRSTVPVVALRYDQDTLAADLARWCDGKVELVASGPPVVWVPTTRGPRPALLGDWIVQQAAHDFRPYSTSEFAARFSQADDDNVLGMLGGALSA